MVGLIISVQQRDHQHFGSRRNRNTLLDATGTIGCSLSQRAILEGDLGAGWAAPQTNPGKRQADQSTLGDPGPRRLLG